MVFLHLLSYSNFGIFLISLFLYPLLLVMVFHCFLLLFLILLSFLHLYWLYQSYICFCIVLQSSGYLLPCWSLVQVCLTLGVQKLLFFLLFCISLSSIPLSFSALWTTFSTFVFVPVIVDHGLSSLSSPPSFLILFSIFSILLCSLSISMVSALFCKSVLSSSIFH